MSTSPTVQIATVCCNSDSGHAPSSATHVPLRRLCSSCAKVIQRNEVEQSTWTSDAPIFRLCTFAHLFIYHPTCHFCTFLLATVERNGKRQEKFSEDPNIYIQFDHVQEAVNIAIAHTMPTELPGDSFVAAFELKKYSCKCMTQDSQYEV
jgi:hypothetical protein